MIREDEECKRQEVGYCYTVSREDNGQRLDKFLSQQLEATGFSRSKISQWIKSGRARVDDMLCKRPSARLEAGQVVQLEAEFPDKELQPEKGQLDIVYEDQDLLVLNKPAGLNVHPAASDSEATLVHRLLYNFPNLKELDLFLPVIVHRLDKDTSGLLLIALNEDCKHRLSEDFAQRRIDKTYAALVWGVPEPKSAKIDLPLGRDPKSRVRMAVLPKEGRAALSEYELLWKSGDEKFSLLKINIHSGRTHQIRVHLAHLGHPVLGDRVYGPQGNKQLARQYPVFKSLAKRQMLHAWQLGFKHPLSGKELYFMQPVPKDFWRLLLLMQKKVQLVGLTGMPGCGKSLLLKVLQDLGVCTWSADQAVKELYQPGADGWEFIKRRFGDRFLQGEDGPVDKGKLFSAMQKSENIRKEVVQAIHPMVQHSLLEFKNENSRQRLIVAEVPLLIESGWQSRFDLVVGIYSPKIWRQNWLRQGRGWDEDMLDDIESWQYSDKDKLQSCQLILGNPGTKKELQERAAKLLQVLTSIRRNEVHRFLAWLAKLKLL